VDVVGRAVVGGGVGLGWVYLVPEGKRMLSHEDRQVRRRGMAEAVRAGERLTEVARRFGVVPATVREACRLHGVKSSQPARKLSRSTYRVLAALFDRTRTTRQIAQDFAVSHQWVYLIYQKAVAAGIPVPVRAPGRKAVADE
jgi:transposase-like protein